MSEQEAAPVAPAASKESTPPPAPEAPKAPEVDTEAIIKRAKTEAIKEADAKLKRIAQAITGEKEEPQVDPLLVAFAKNPAGVLAEVGVAAKEQIRADLRAEQEQQAKLANIAKPYLEQYPEMTQHMDTANAYMHEALARKVPLEEAVKGAFETTAKKLNLKSLSEEERQRRVAYAGIPPVGSPGMRSPEQKRSNAMDYVTHLRRNAKAIRGELPPSK